MDLRQVNKSNIHASENNSNDDTIELKHEPSPFTIIPNKVIQNTSAKNMQSVFLWIYFKSLPDSWTIRKKHITEHFDMSTKKYERCMAWLKSVGLIRYEQQRRADGVFGTHKVVVLNGKDFNESVATNKLVERDVLDEQPLPQKPTHRKTGAAENGALIKKRDLEINNKKINNKKFNKKEISSDTGNETGLPVENHLSAGLEGPQSKELANPTRVYKETLFPMPAPSRGLSSDRSLSVPDLEAMNPHKIPLCMIEDWLAVRKKKRTAVTQTAWSRLNNQLAKCDDPVEAFEIMVAQGWNSLNHTWLDNYQGKNNRPLMDDELDSTDWINRI